MSELVSALGQFGAVALICGIVLYMNYKHQDQMAARLQLLETEMLTVIRQNTEALQELKKRPCMMEDRTGKRERKTDHD